MTVAHVAVAAVLLIVLVQLAASQEEILAGAVVIAWTLARIGSPRPRHRHSAWPLFAFLFGARPRR